MDNMQQIIKSSKDGTMSKKKSQYPKQLFIVKENEGTEDEFFNTSESLDDMEIVNEERAVAVYQLVRVVKVVNKTEVEK